MTFTILRRIVTQALIVVVALAAILTSGAPAQSLGDVARRDTLHALVPSADRTHGGKA